MNDTVISVEGLGKRYTLGTAQKGERYTALRDVFAEKAKSLFRRPSSRFANGNSQPPETDFWALKDVSFEVRRGEVVGIIGRNGAGKSTLLKILSRITEPTEGSIRLRGRVASLLEVGTGFHPELTGRENIFLNGAILGMSRVEIKAKFDEIVAFAGVERFLDTPVKRYSSGMYVRLAFAVAAHLEPEILIVDEVLAVGDAEFQKKCLQRMETVSRLGRTVLFVSHDLTSIARLCTRGIMLDGGHATGFADIAAAIAHYCGGAGKFARLVTRNAPGGIYIAEAWLDEPNIILSRPAELVIHLVIRSNSARRLSLDWRIYDQMNRAVGYGSLKILQDEWLQIRAGDNPLSLHLELPSLAAGNYSVEFDLCIPWAECFYRSKQGLEWVVSGCSPFGGSQDFKQEWNYGSLPFRGSIQRHDASIS